MKARCDAWPRCLPPDSPPGLKEWLNERGSLTRRIMAQCTPAAPFSLRVLNDAPARPHRDEYAALDLPHGRRARVREVLLQRGGTPLVFTHAVVALRDLRGAWRCIDAIGSRSLGSILFADPAIDKGPLRFRRIDARHPLFRKAALCLSAPPAYLWARRALYSRAGRALLVSEVFLGKMTG